MCTRIPGVCFLFFEITTSHEPPPFIPNPIPPPKSSILSPWAVAQAEDLQRYWHTCVWPGFERWARLPLRELQKAADRRLHVIEAGEASSDKAVLARALEVVRAARAGWPAAGAARM